MGTTNTLGASRQTKPRKTKAAIAAPRKGTPPPRDEDWLSVDEVAHELHVERRTIYNLLGSDEHFPRPFRYMGRLRWKRREVEEYRRAIELADRVEFGERLPEPPGTKARRERQAADHHTE